MPCRAHGSDRGAAGAGGARSSDSLLIRSFSSLPGLKYGTFFGGTSTLSPVFGFRPLRGSRRRRRKLPNPRSSIFSPRCSASTMLLNTVSTMTSECFFVRSEARETSSTSSALVIGNPRFLVGFLRVSGGSRGFYGFSVTASHREPLGTIRNPWEPLGTPDYFKCLK